MFSGARLLWIYVRSFKLSAKCIFLGCRICKAFGKIPRRFRNPVTCTLEEECEKGLLGAPRNWIHEGLLMNFQLLSLLSSVYARANNECGRIAEAIFITLLYDSLLSVRNHCNFQRPTMINTTHGFSISFLPPQFTHIFNEMYTKCSLAPCLSCIHLD